MSVLQNPIVGRMKQKIGGVVMTTWKGINVMKGKPLTVANPKTDPQLMRRSALTQIVVIARQTVALMSLGFLEQAVRKSAFNAFVGYNLRNGFNYAAPPAATLLPASLLFAQGTIAQTPITSAVADFATQNLLVNFSALVQGPGQSASDICKIVAYNVTQNKWEQGAQGDFARSAANSDETWSTPFMAVGNTIRYYVFFYNAASRKSSDSVTGTVVCA